jgi:Flp pilus assembly protein TadG
MNHNNRFVHHGQTLVEFALLLPILLLLAVVIFDLGRAVYYYSAIHNAAREGARYGVIHPDDPDGMVAAAENYAVGLDDLIVDEPEPFITSEPVGDNDSYSVHVTISYCFTPVTPLVEIFVPENHPGHFGCRYLLLTSEAVMRTEAKP